MEEFHILVRRNGNSLTNEHACKGMENSAIKDLKKLS